jgi:hypothetical protein
MKNTFLSLVLAAMLSGTAISCSDDDGTSGIDHANVSESILGRWYIAGGTINGGPFEAYNGNDCETARDYQEFTSAGTLKFVGYNEQCVVDEQNATPYSIAGNILTVESEIFGDMVYTIESLTSQQLLLKSTNNTPDGVETEVMYWTRN